MKDLTREEERIRQEISKMDEVFEKKKWKRVKTTFFVLTGVIYFLAFALDKINSVKEFLCCLVAAPFLAGVIIYGSMLVSLYMMTGGMEEVKHIARLEGELRAIMRLNESRNKDEL